MAKQMENKICLITGGAGSIGVAAARAPNPLLVQAIVRAHNWLEAVSDETYNSIEDLASRLDLHPKVIRKGLRLAFLSPTITEGV